MVNNSDTKVSYQGNGQTTVFPFSFPFIQRDYIKVAIYDSLTDETKTIDSDYYVDTVANTVIYPGYEPGQEPAEALRPPILPATSTITIYRQTDVDQLTDLGEKYPLKDIENMADKLTEIIQEQAETLGRTVKVPVGDPKTPEEKLTDLQNYVKSAADSAADAATSESSAQRAAEAAATSEANAATSERLASGYADTASDAASRAENSAISARAYNAPDYDNETTYQAGEVVTYTDGNSYKALQETTGNEPPNIIYWQKVTDYVGDDFFEVDEYGYIVPMDSPSHSRYWRVDQYGYIVPIEGGDGGYRPDTRSLSSEYLNVTNEGYVKHLRADDIAAQEVDADEMTAEVAAFNTLTANAVNAGMVTTNDIIAKGPWVDVRAYGAKGDGVTDDTAAFRSAISAAQGKTLVVPQGAYLITENLFADGVTEVYDKGTYSKKPVYKMPIQIGDLANTSCIKANDTTFLPPQVDGDAVSCQGFTYDSKREKLIFAFVQEYNYQILYLVTPTFDDYGHIVGLTVDTSVKHYDLYHCNSLTYCAETDKVYLLLNGTGTDGKHVAVINPETLLTENTLEFDDVATHIAYDSECKVFIRESYNDTTYTANIYDSSWNFIKTVTIDAELNNAGRNSMCCHNGVIVGATTKSVFEYDLLGNFKKSFDYAQTYAPSLEIQDFEYIKGNYYFNSYFLGAFSFWLFSKDFAVSKETNAHLNPLSLVRPEKNTMPIFTGHGRADRIQLPALLERMGLTGFGARTKLPTDADWGNLNGLYYVNGDNGFSANNSGYPANAGTAGTLFSIRNPEESYPWAGIQVYLSNDTNLYFRNLYNGTWKAWKKLTGTAVS